MNSVIDQVRPAVLASLGPQQAQAILSQLELFRLQANQQLDQALAQCQAAISQALQAAVVRQALASAGFTP